MIGWTSTEPITSHSQNRSQFVHLHPPNDDNDAENSCLLINLTLAIPPAVASGASGGPRDNVPSLSAQGKLLQPLLINRRGR